MNTEESRLLRVFLDQLIAIRGVVKDPEAEQRIQQAAQAQPDAVYLLVQKALLQEQALNRAKGEIGRLQQQLNQANAPRSAAPASGFLGQDPWSAPAQRGVGYAPASSAPAQACPPPGTAAGTSPFGSFLGSVAATAAGVAGGAFLFHGLESFMGHHDAGRGFSDAAFDSAHQTPENVTINQFYGDDPAPGHPGQADAHYGEYTTMAGDDENGPADDDDFTGMDV